MFEPDHPWVTVTIRQIEADLVHAGGVHRYLGDTYYGGGEWLLLAGFLGWHYAETGRTSDARRELAWIASHANERDELPEQTPDHLLAPAELPGWETRWGAIATPLLWSHAMFLTLAFELGAVNPSVLEPAPQRHDGSLPASSAGPP
jgi:GH15 family glucan-1,4-alpha-glucosidase